MLGGVGRAGDHAVGEPAVDHHRPEVADVQHRLAREVQRDALVLAELEVLLGEVLGQLGLARVDELDLAEVDPETVGLGADHLGVAEDGQVHHVAAEQHLGGPEDPLVLALGEHDALAVGPGALEQLVLEHQRGDALGARHLDTRFQDAGVDVLLEHRQRGLDLALVAGPHDRRDRGDPPGGGPGVGVDREDRQVDVRQTVEEALEVGVEGEPAGEHQRGDVVEGAGRAGQQRARDDVGPVTRGDREHPFVEVVEDVGQAHGRDLDVGDLAVEVADRAGQLVGIQRVHDLAHRRLGQHRHRRQRPHRFRDPGRLDGGPDVVEDRGGDLVDDDRRDRAALGHQRLPGEVEGVEHLVGQTVGPADHGQDRGTEVVGDLRVDVELDRGGGAGVLRAVVEHEGVAVLQALGGVQDALEDLLAPALGEPLGDLVRAEDRHLARGEIEVVAAPDQLDALVGLLAGRDDGAQVADLAQPPGQQLHQPERDQRAACPRLQGREVETVGHG